MNYILAPEAIQDLQELTDYLADIDLELAEKILTKFENKCRYLVRFPKIGRTYSYIRSDLRGLPLNGHIIFYRLGTEALAVGWVSDSVTQRNACYCWVSLPQPNLRDDLLSVNQGHIIFV